MVAGSRTAQLLVNGTHLTQQQQNKCKGRGLLPKLVLRDLADKSSRKSVEHALWSLPTPFARIGADLFSTLWGTISGLLRRTAASVRQDAAMGNSALTNRSAQLYFPFLNYLRTSSSSPLLPSLAKLKLMPDRWLAILSWPFADSENQLLTWAKEAASHAARLTTLAKAAAGRAFEDKISEALDNGDAWLHKWAKDEDAPTSTIRSDLVASNLQPTANSQYIYNIFVQCGSIIDIVVGTCTNTGTNLPQLIFQTMRPECELCRLVGRCMTGTQSTSRGTQPATSRTLQPS